MADFQISRLIAALEVQDNLTPQLAKAKAEQEAFKTSTQGVVAELDKLAAQMVKDGQSAEVMRTALDQAAREMGAIGAAAVAEAALVEQAARAQQSAMQDLLGTVTKLGLGFTAFGLAQQAIGMVKSEAADAVKSMTDLATQTLKLSEVTGMSAEKSSEYIGVAGRYNISAQQLTQGLSFLEKGLQGVLDKQEGLTGGQANFSNALHNLGISATDTNGHLKSTEQVLGEIEDAFHNSTNATMEADAARALFGRGLGTDFIPLLKEGKVSIQELLAAQKEWGNYLSGDNLKAIIAVEREQATVEAQWKGMKLSIAQDALPAISVGLIGLDAILKTLQKDASDAFNPIKLVADAITSGAFVKATQDFKKAQQEAANTRTNAPDFGPSPEDTSKKIESVKTQFQDLSDTIMRDARDTIEAEIAADARRNKQIADDRTRLSKELGDLYRSETDAQASELQRAADVRATLAKEEKSITAEEVRSEQDAATKIAEIRSKLAQDIAERWRTLQLSLQQMNESELRSEAQNSQARLDELRTYQQTVSSMDFSDRQRAESTRAERERATAAGNQRLTDLDAARNAQVLKFSEDQAAADLKYNEDRESAYSSYNQKILDSQKAASDQIAQVVQDQDRKVADAQVALFGTATVGPLTAASLDARRQAAEALLKATVERNQAVKDATEKGQDSVDKAKTQAQQELDVRLKALDQEKAARALTLSEEEAAAQKKYDADRAREQQATRDQLAQLDLRDKQAAEKDQFDRARSKENADYKIQQLQRDRDANYDRYREQFKLAEDQYTHEIGLAKGTADEQIRNENLSLADKLKADEARRTSDEATTTGQLTDLQKTADRRYQDYLARIDEDWNAEREAIKAAKQERTDREVTIKQTAQDRIDASEKARAKLVADNKEIASSFKDINTQVQAFLDKEASLTGATVHTKGTVDVPTLTQPTTGAAAGLQGLIAGPADPNGPRPLTTVPVQQTYTIQVGNITLQANNPDDMWAQLIAIGRARGANLSP